MIVRHAGDSALLVDTGDTDLAHRLRAYLIQAQLTGVREIIPGLSTLLIVTDPLALDIDALAKAIPTWELPPGQAAETQEIVVEVTYDGPDLDAVAELTGLAVDDVVERHVRSHYSVAFLGFVPGFGYLTGLDAALWVPRLDNPRQRVEQGSVAIAGNMTVIYPQATPGGWRVIGQANLTLFDASKSPPNVLAPGDRVRFKRRA